MANAIIYDMDGVLIDSEPLWRIAEKAAFAKVGMNLTDDDCKLTMGYRTSEVMDFWWERSPWEGMSKAEMEQEIINGVGQLIEKQGEALPGVKDSLEYFKSKEWLIGLASSSPMVLIESVVHKLEIADYFQVIHSAQFEEKGKPDPAVYLTAAQNLKVSPEQCWVIEDSVHGMHAGLNAGMQVIAIPAEEDRENPAFLNAHKLLNSLLEVEGESFA